MVHYDSDDSYLTDPEQSQDLLVEDSLNKVFPYNPGVKSERDIAYDQRVRQSIISSIVENIKEKNLSDEEISLYIKNISVAVSIFPVEEAWDSLDKAHQFIFNCGTLQDTETLAIASESWSTSPHYLMKTSSDILFIGQQLDEAEDPEYQLELFQYTDSMLKYWENYPEIGQNKELIKSQFINNILFPMIKRREDLDDITRASDTMKELLGRNINSQDATTIIRILYRYVRKNGFSDIDAQGFQQRLIPSVLNRSAGTEIFTKLNENHWDDEDIWGVSSDAASVADFVCRSYTLPVNPKNITDLLLNLREIPATEYAKLESNRTDGLLLMDEYGTLKDLIHDQHPKVYEVLTAVDYYYKTGDFSQLESKVKDANSYLSNSFVIKQLRDLDLYEKVIYGQNGKPERYIDIIRRVIHNTQPEIVNPPITSDEELNTLMDTVSTTSLSSSEYYKKIGETCGYLYDRLSLFTEVGLVGVGPDTISAIAWIDQSVFKGLRSMPYEYQRIAYKQEWFSNILRFHEIISSYDDYNRDEIEEFIHDVTGANGHNDAYKLINTRIAERLYGISKLYEGRGQKDIAQKLWSGNTTDQLLGLVVPHSPQTSAGRRYLQDEK